MKICYLANTGIPSKNASAIQIVKMCEAFSELKNNVTLITTNASSGNIFDLYSIKTKFKFIKMKIMVLIFANHHPKYYQVSFQMVCEILVKIPF